MVLDLSSFLNYVALKARLLKKQQCLFLFRTSKYVQEAGKQPGTAVLMHFRENTKAKLAPLMWNIYHHYKRP